MPDADRVTFRVLGGQFARDADQIFQMGKKIEGADLASFSVISGQYGYAQDKNHIYGPLGIIQDADPETFRMLTKDYAIDAGHVFFHGRNIPEANSGSFYVIKSGLYAADDRSVFYAGKLLENTAPEGFIVRGPRAFAADGRTFFQGQIEKGEIPVDDETETPDDVTPSDTLTNANAWTLFRDKLAPYTVHFTGKNMTFWMLVGLSILGLFSLVFVFFADRNDEPVPLWKSVAKTFIAAVIGIVSVWIASLFFKPLIALIVGLLVGFFFFIGLWSALGWIKSFLISILTVIGILILMALGILILRAIFGDTQDILTFINQPKIQLMGIMKIMGLFGGAWLISSQLDSSLSRSILQALVATVVSVIVLGLIIWITHIGTVLSIILFSVIYAALLWIMRFRMVSNLFAETVRIVRVALILGVMIGLVVWIVL